MPKGPVKREKINKDVFKKILKIKKSTIPKLGEELSIECSEKTIRRSLGKGEMRKQYLHQIAKFLDVDYDLLTGDMVAMAFQTKDPVIKKVCLSPLTHVEDYPYISEDESRMRREKIDETLKRILLLYNISYVQFQNMESEKQYNFQHDLFEAILPVIYRYYDMDSNGDTSMISCYGILVELENYKDSMDEQIYAETILRKKFLRMLPKGYSKEDIIKMNTDGLIALDLHIQKCEYEDR